LRKVLALSDCNLAASQIILISIFSYSKGLSNTHYTPLPHFPMPDAEVGSHIQTGALQTEPSQMAKKCLNIIKKYRTGTQTALGKVTIIQGITSLLTSGADRLSETKVNDTLGSYLRIIEQHDKSVNITERHASSRGMERSETADEPALGSKRPGSPKPVSGAMKPDKTEFP
jgi:hypothetical protein